MLWRGLDKHSLYFALGKVCHSIRIAAKRLWTWAGISGRVRWLACCPAVSHRIEVSILARKGACLELIPDTEALHTGLGDGEKALMLLSRHLEAAAAQSRVFVLLLPIQAAK